MLRTVQNGKNDSTVPRPNLFYELIGRCARGRESQIEAKNDYGRDRSADLGLVALRNGDPNAALTEHDVPCADKHDIEVVSTWEMPDSVAISKVYQEVIVSHHSVDDVFEEVAARRLDRKERI